MNSIAVLRMFLCVSVAATFVEASTSINPKSFIHELSKRTTSANGINIRLRRSLQPDTVDFSFQSFSSETLLERVARSSSRFSASFRKSAIPHRGTTCNTCLLTRRNHRHRLPRRRGCHNKTYTRIQKCEGYCESYEIPKVNDRIERIHSVCTAQTTRTVRVVNPYCEPGVNPFFYITVPTSCNCRNCDPTRAICL
uniref:Putative glycoprotein hormone-beta5 n=1 Tax=Ciona intestinalis TaxID=7719 RepID=C6SUS0_CIOIN|nr:uncharacterized protein LOC101243416 precursor [Ciona intestinalis]CAR95356.1 TPA: putative glycoprotein hormone-beta5 [Ciona intestinalis]|eukprot:NP_001265879.1 uncharacterized protein LOC101243416 precursor [Ciona intestinalis]